MQASQLPSKIALPFANSGTKNTIPTASQIGVTPGAASLTDGFPPLTFTPLASGGIPPAGADFNGILNMITAVQQWQCAGGIFKYDATFSTSIGGYPKGATLCSTSNDVTWLNLADNNATNPDATDGSAVNWFPVDGSGIALVSGITNVNVTLTPAQFSKPMLNLTGTLTGNVQIIFPSLPGAQWLVSNNTTGAFAVTAKTAADTGIVIPQAGRLPLFCSAGSTMQWSGAFGVTPPQFDNSALVATMAALQRMGLQYSSQTFLTANTTLTAAHFGGLIETSSTGVIALALPLANVCIGGGSITFFNDGTNNLVINRAGADIIAPNNSSSLTSITLGPGDTLVLVTNGNNKWLAIGGSAQLPYTTATLGRLIGVQVFASAGAFTYTPTAGMQTVIAEGVGGGGAGGGTPATSASQIALSYGGGAGAYAKGRFTAAQIGASKPVTIGVGGSPAAGASGGNGGITSLSTLMSIGAGNGGSGGAAVSNAQAFLGASIANNGAGNPSGANVIGIPGASSGPVGVTPAGSGFGGTGGASLLGTGGYGLNATAGGNAGGFGSGGGGTSVGVSAGATSGGFGSGGILIIWEYA